MSDETKGSETPAETQAAPAESPAVENKAGGSEQPAPQPAAESPKPPIPGNQYFAKKRIEEREQKQISQTVEELRAEVERLKQERQETAFEPEPSQPATPSQSPDVREVARQEMANFLREQQYQREEAAANEWLASQKHVDEPKFKEAVTKYLAYLQQQESDLGLKSNPKYLADQAYRDVAAHFGVDSGAGSEALSDAAARASAPAPSGGSQAGVRSDSEQVSASEITDQIMAAMKRKDGETYNKLIAKRDKAEREGRLIQ